MDSLTDNLQRQMVDSITDIFSKIKAEEERYDSVQKTLVEFPKMKTDLKVALQKLNTLQKE